MSKLPEVDKMPNEPAASPAIKVFISYSHKDEELKDELYVHLAALRKGKIQAWQDRDIDAGDEWDAAIKNNFNDADIILLLITPRFIASNYCYEKETQWAIKRHENGDARVIPIIMKPCDWQDTDFSKLQVLPKDGKPVTKWDNQDEAMVNVVKGIRRVVENLTKKQTVLA